MLCFRCMHRARFLEYGSRPRYECGQITNSKMACYMYKPCLPIVVKKMDPKDKRPWPATGYLSARSEAVRVLREDELNFEVEGFDGNVVFMWELK